MSNSDSFPAHATSSRKFHDEIVNALPGKKAEERREFKDKPVKVESSADERIDNVGAIDSDLFVLEPNHPAPAEKTSAPQSGKPPVKVEVLPKPEAGE